MVKVLRDIILPIGVAVGLSLGVAGAAKADEPNPSDYCPTGQEVVCKDPNQVKKKRVRCASQFEGNGDCKVPADAAATGIPADAYVTGLCPTEQLCYNASLAKASEVPDNGELSDRVDVLRDNVDGHCGRIGKHDGEIKNLGENVQNLYTKVDEVQDYAKGVADHVNELLGEEGQFALNKMKERCGDQYTGMQTRITALEEANQKVKSAEQALADYLGTPSCQYDSEGAEESQETAPKLTPSEALRSSVDAQQPGVDVNKTTELLSGLELAAKDAKVKADELASYKDHVINHPCGYEEPRGMRFNVDTSAVLMDNGDIDGEVSAGVHAPVGDIYSLGMEATMSGLGTKSETDAYGEKGSIQNGKTTTDLKKSYGASGVFSADVSEKFRVNLEVGVSEVSELNKNEFTLFGEQESIKSEDRKTAFDAAFGASLGDKVRLKVEGHYNTEMGPYGTGGLEFNF